MFVGYIYIIFSDKNNDFYVGKTNRSVQKRFQEHIYKASQKQSYLPLYQTMNEIGIENWKIKELDSVCSEDDKEQFEKDLENKETEWINRLKPVLNVEKNCDNVLHHIQEVVKNIYIPEYIFEYQEINSKWFLSIQFNSIFFKHKIEDIQISLKRHDIFSMKDMFGNTHLNILENPQKDFCKCRNIDPTTREVETITRKIVYTDLINGFIEKMEKIKN